MWFHEVIISWRNILIIFTILNLIKPTIISGLKLRKKPNPNDHKNKKNDNHQLQHQEENEYDERKLENYINRNEQTENHNRANLQDEKNIKYETADNKKNKYEQTYKNHYYHVENNAQIDQEHNDRWYKIATTEHKDNANYVYVQTKVDNENREEIRFQEDDYEDSANNNKEKDITQSQLQFEEQNKQYQIVRDLNNNNMNRQNNDYVKYNERQNWNRQKDNNRYYNGNNIFSNTTDEGASFITKLITYISDLFTVNKSQNSTWNILETIHRFIG